VAHISTAEGQLEDLSEIYPWQELQGGKIVDMGGGNGHVSIHLANVSTAPALFSPCHA